LLSMSSACELSLVYGPLGCDVLSILWHLRVAVADISMLLRPVQVTIGRPTGLFWL